MNSLTDDLRTLRYAGLRAVAFIRLHAPTVILVTYVVLAFVYSAVTPVFEAPDENYHFAFIQHLAQSGELPVQNPAIKTPWYQEGSQPPLYYLLGSLIARIVPALDDPYPLAVNPHAEIGIGLAQINHNFFAHTSAESFPWRGIPLQVHLVRLFGIALGACTVYAAYRTARLALPNTPAIGPLVMAFVAFNPMFLFVSGNINNDNLVTTFGALVSWLTLAIYRHSSPLVTTRSAALGLGSGNPNPQQSGVRRWYGLIFLLGIALALGSLSKISGLTLYVAPGALLILLRFKRQISWRQFIAAVGIFALTFVVLAGWWYVRNWQLYGDPTGLNMMITIIQPRKTPYTLTTMFEEMQGLRISFWALFGWFNVIGPNWFLGLMDTLTLVGFLGCLVWVCLEIRARRGGSLIPVGLLALQLLVTFASLINWTRLTPGTQGRLLFPAMTAIATLMVSGWYAVEDLFHLLGTSRITVMGVRTQAMRIPRVRTAFARDAEPSWNNHARLATASLVVVGMVALFSPITTIRHAYAPPPTVARLPDDAIPVQVRFDKIEIAGFRIDKTPILPGGQLPITIYYRGEPDTRNLSLSLTALDWHGHAAGKIDTYPGSGNLPTSAFEPGKLYADSYRLTIDPTLNGPVQGKIEFDLWNFDTKAQVKPVRADGTPLEALILRGGTILSTAGAPQPAIAQPAVFSGALRLNGYTLVPGERGETSVILVWEALSPVYEDFTVFLHLETTDGKVLDQDDGPPLRDNYPTTAWAVKQPFADLRAVHTADLPPGTYRLTVGLYRARDNSRLPVDTGGDMVILKTPITVKLSGRNDGR